MASATLIRIFFRSVAGMSRQGENASAAALAASSISSAVPWATSQMMLLSTGVIVWNTPPAPELSTPATRFRMPVSRKRAR